MLSEKPSLSPNPAKGVLLCIDNAVPVLEVLACVLEERGYSVLVSPGARHGLSLFETKEIDLVILDYDMPEMNGYSGGAGDEADQANRADHHEFGR